MVRSKDFKSKVKEFVKETSGDLSIIKTIDESIEKCLKLGCFFQKKFKNGTEMAIGRRNNPVSGITSIFLSLSISGYAQNFEVVIEGNENLGKLPSNNKNEKKEEVNSEKENKEEKPTIEKTEIEKKIEKTKTSKHSTNPIKKTNSRTNRTAKSINKK